MTVFSSTDSSSEVFSSTDSSSTIFSLEGFSSLSMSVPALSVNSLNVFSGEPQAVKENARVIAARSAVRRAAFVLFLYCFCTAFC